MFESTDRSCRGYLVNTVIILIFQAAFLFSSRGDIISTQILDTRNVVNNQVYIDDELNQIVSDQFSIDPVEYGFWLSGCNTEHLYVDIGTGTYLGHDPHAYHVSGYRCSFMDITGIDLHITGLNESGLLTIEYPDR